MSLVNLPQELVYRVLNHLSLLDIIVSTRDVCLRLNMIVDTYHRYQVCLKQTDPQMSQTFSFKIGSSTN